jgi:predicted PurR-regulated permease PerM
LERSRVPRPLAILVVYLVTIGAVTLLFLLLAPVIREQVAVFQHEAPAQLGNLRQAWQANGNALLNGPGQELLGRVIAAIRNPQMSALPVPREAAMDVLAGVGGGLIGILTVFVIAFYYLMEKAWLQTVILNEVAPAHRARIAHVLALVEAKVGDWLRGQLFLCLVIGAMATVGYGALGVRFWPLLGLWAGITEIIPILGPWLGGIPAVIIALTQSWEKALVVAAYAALIQLLENTTLVPRVMKGAVGLSPLTVFLAILSGTQLLGMAGAILAIPVAAAVQVVLSEFLAARKESPPETALSSWRWMRGATMPTPPAVRPAEPPPVVHSAPAARPGEER